MILMSGVDRHREASVVCHGGGALPWLLVCPSCPQAPKPARPPPCRTLDGGAALLWLLVRPSCPQAPKPSICTWPYGTCCRYRCTCRYGSDTDLYTDIGADLNMDLDWWCFKKLRSTY